MGKVLAALKICDCLQVKFRQKILYASMAELADAPDLGSGGEIHAGSIPVTRTNGKVTGCGFA